MKSKLKEDPQRYLGSAERCCSDVESCIVCVSPLATCWPRKVVCYRVSAAPLAVPRLLRSGDRRSPDVRAYVNVSCALRRGGPPSSTSSEKRQQYWQWGSALRKAKLERAPRTPHLRYSDNSSAGMLTFCRTIHRNEE